MRGHRNRRERMMHKKRGSKREDGRESREIMRNIKRRGGEVKGEFRNDRTNLEERERELVLEEGKRNQREKE